MEIKRTPPNEEWAESNAYWIIHLSNGEVLYQDHDNIHSWPNLKRYVAWNKLRITRIILKFRSNEIHFAIKDEIDIIYLSRGVGKEWTAEREDRFIIVGWNVTPTMVQRYWYRTPELIEHMVTADEISDLVRDRAEFLYFMPPVENTVFPAIIADG